MDQSARRVAGGVAWSSIEAAVSAMLSFVSAFVVARIVGPAELGAGAAAVAADVVFWIGLNALFADALVQRTDLAAAEARAALTVSIAAGLAGSGLLTALGWPLARALGDARLVPMCAILGLTLPLVGAGGAMQGLLTRRRRYPALAARAIAGQGLGTLSGIAAALAGWGAWALVVQQAVTSAAGALALAVHAPVTPAPVGMAALRDARRLLAVGVPLAAGAVVLHSRYRLFALIVGGSAGTAALGQLHMAFRLVDTVRDLALSALWRLMLPPMASLQHDLPALQRLVDRSMATSGLVLFPVACVLALSVRPAVSLLLGPVWEPSGNAAALLAGLMLYSFLIFPGAVANVARGGARASFVSTLAGTGATLLVAGLLQPRTPTQGACVWIAAQIAVSPYTMRVTARALNAPLMRHVQAGIPALALSLAASAAAWAVPVAIGAPSDPAALILARLAVAACVYLPFAWLILRDAFRDALLTTGLLAASTTQ